MSDGNVSLEKEGGVWHIVLQPRIADMRLADALV